MKFSTVAAFATTLFATSAVAKQVACVVDNKQVDVVDLETGTCPFTVPEKYPVSFRFVSLEDYDVEWYYTRIDNEKYSTDIRNAGRVINIPARLLYGRPGAPLFQVHLEKEPASNSTAAIRKRLMKEVPIAKRDEVDDFIASIEDTEGTAVEDGDLILQVEDVVESSSAAAASTAEESSAAASGAEESSAAASGAEESSAAASGAEESTTAASGSEESTTGAPQVTVTTESEVIITVTSCSNDICVGTTVPGAETTVTTTVSGTTTIYTTYCPLSSVETVESTKIITVTSCADNKCHETTVEATPLTTETVTEGTVTEYVTYCPLSSGAEGAEEEATKTITVTSCSNDICVATAVPGTKTTVTTAAPNGETTVYTTYCPESSVETVESTKIITVTSCSEDKCHETTVEATPSTAETVVEGTTTEYVTYCPVTSGAEEESTKIITVTSCSNDVCQATTVPAVKTTVSTAAPGGETTVYTTYTPESSVETVESTKIITQVVCSEDKCHETTVEATPSTTSGTVAGETEVTEYVTYCPVTSAPGETVATEVVTSEGSVYVPETVEVTSEGSTYETVVYKTVSKVTEGTTEAAETPAGPTTVTTASASGSAVASGSETGVISTYAGSAAVNGASFLALAMIPLAYFF